MNNDLGAWRNPMDNAKATGNAHDVIHNTIKNKSPTEVVEGLKTLGIGSHKVSVESTKNMSETTNKAMHGTQDFGKMLNTGSITKISKRDRIKRGFGGAKYEMKINYEHGEIVVKLSKKDIKNIEKQQNTEGGQRKPFETYFGEDEPEVDNRNWTTVNEFDDNDVAASYPATEAIPSAPLESMYAPSAPMETYRPSAPMETYRPSAPMETYRPETGTVKKQPSVPNKETKKMPEESLKPNYPDLHVVPNKGAKKMPEEPLKPNYPDLHVVPNKDAKIKPEEPPEPKYPDLNKITPSNQPHIPENDQDF